MAYVPSFEHDIFISYGHADNLAGRVTAFREDLVAGLTVGLGSRAFHKPNEWVFFDRSTLKLGDEFSPKLERAARRHAASMVSAWRSALEYLHPAPQTLCVSTLDFMCC